MFHLIQLACGGGEHMRDLCRVLITKHNEPYSVQGVRDAWAQHGLLGCKDRI
ncbi:hypothetical protein P692DRAFT_20592257 [Suillus brevipes Sb2]|nr:hypothetical protein P692DRAFT_20592257 [Suillus brevipes Sb2]